MLLSKKQQWILELIKGPDISPAGKTPGQYSSKNIVEIAAGGKQYTIDPSEVFDFNGPDSLTVTANSHTYTIAWDSIERLSFRKPPTQTTPVLQPEYSRDRRKLFHSPLGKRIG